MMLTDMGRKCLTWFWGNNDNAGGKAIYFGNEIMCNSNAIKGMRYRYFWV